MDRGPLPEDKRLGHYFSLPLLVAGVVYAVSARPSERFAGLAVTALAIAWFVVSLRPTSAARRRVAQWSDTDAFELRLDGDHICARCLRFIEADERVRRSSLGLAEHVACPREEALSRR